MTTQTTQPTQSKPMPKAPSTLERWFPIGMWLPKYKWGKFLTADLIAAVSVAALLIPESMGYSSVAGVPVQIGLYAAPLALIGYALFGGSKLLVFAAAGSTAAVSASVVGALSGGDQSTAVTLTAALALATGVVFIVAGLIRLGWVTNFMSKSIMAGFITGMSIQIIVGQFGKLFGVEVADGNTFQKLWSAISQVGDWNWTATVIGVGALLLIFAIQRFIPKLPAALTAVVISSVIVAVAGPDIDLVAEIPQGLPSFTLPTGIDGSTWLSLLAAGAVVALVGFSEGWGASANISKKTHDSLDTNQEFRAYGAGNIGAGLLGGMAVTGSLSKSSAAMSAGAKSQMSNILLAGMVLLTLAFFAPLFQWLPETVLAAIVINAMAGSASPSKMRKLFQIDKVDFALGLITLLLVLALDLLPAMIVGIILSIIYIIYRISFPGRAVMGQVAETGDFEVTSWVYGQHSGTTNSQAKPVPGVIVYRLASPLISANAEPFKKTGEELLIKAAAEGELPHTMVIDFEEILFVDFVEEIGEQRFYDTIRHAVSAATSSGAALKNEKTTSS